MGASDLVAANRPGPAGGRRRGCAPSLAGGNQKLLSSSVLFPMLPPGATKTAMGARRGMADGHPLSLPLCSPHG
ncbi:hypothetical protein SORBI_3005G144400 [Sorghum bicolor]|uniref:Uncharacterized protein n=1 Tax=Sorghum bicolor TaxID=4558 RepID=A0A1B6PSH9_SORBI|nr:hypothetical protein SORBI_3005G144400 [Sorghum bicolor]